MILEAHVLLLFSCAVFNIKNADKVSGPTSHQAVEYLEEKLQYFYFNVARIPVFYLYERKIEEPLF